MVLTILTIVGLAACDLDPVSPPEADLDTVTTPTPAQFSSSGSIAAFPGATGYGALAQGGRGGRVLTVNTLDDDPKDLSCTQQRCTLRAALMTSGPRIVVFSVAGRIQLKSRIEVRNPYLTIAGQTAPGSGITISTPPGGTGLFFRNKVHDVIIRYVRMRAGYGGDRYGNVNLLIGSGHNFIVDHSSFSWAADKLLVVSKYDAKWSRPISNVTLQRSIFSEAFAFHPTAVQISGANRNAPGISDIDLHHNLFASNSHRNPNLLTEGAKVVNNVVYNWNQGAGQASHKATVDWVNNYFKPGPMTESRFLHTVTYDCRTGGGASYYVAGNIGPLNKDPSADNWKDPNRLVACYYDADGTPLANKVRRNVQLASGPIPIPAQAAKSAYSDVVSDVGANARLTCDGRWTSNVDQVDSRILSEVRNGTGVRHPPATENDVGGFPQLQSGSACADSDRDGMPDAFESRFALNRHDGKDANQDRNGDGYTNIEAYLNGIAP